MTSTPAAATTPAATPRTGEEIRTYLRAQINLALRRPGMYGDEVSLILLFDALAFAEGIEEAWQRERTDLRERGAFVATGVRGALQQLFADVTRGDPAIASVYAEFAHRCGWLAVERELTADEHQQLHAQLPEWCASTRTISDVTDTFGPESVLLGSRNPNYGKTLLYAAKPHQPLVCFHLAPASPGAQRAEPTVLALRHGDQPFPTAFTFTPDGIQRQPRTTSIEVPDLGTIEA